MKLTELELRIKELNNTDPTNPQIFSMLHELITRFIRWKRMVPNYYDAEDMAMILAEDMFYKISKCGTIYYAPLEYIRVVLPSIIVYYRRCNNKEIIPVEGDDELKTALLKLGCSASISIVNDYNRAFDRQYLTELGSVIDEIMRHSKYKDYTSVALNLKTSLVISMITGSEFNYHLDECDEDYVLILASGLKSLIAKQLAESKIQDFSNNLEGLLPSTTEIAK